MARPLRIEYPGALYHIITSQAEAMKDGRYSLMMPTEMGTNGKWCQTKGGKSLGSDLIIDIWR